MSDDAHRLKERPTNNVRQTYVGADDSALWVLTRWLPGLALLRRYERGWLWPDVVAGLTVGAMLVPQSMSYAELAGLAPQYGFYAAIGALFVYAAVGSSRHLGVGPEPGTAILAAATVSSIAGGDAARSVRLMAVLALLVAGVCLVGRVLRFGHLASMLSRPVLVGYITGVGLTLLSSQIAAFTGVAISADSFFPRVAEFLREFDGVRWTTAALASATLGVLLVLRWRLPKLPAALVAVVATSIVVLLFDLEARGVALVGTIPAGLPAPKWPSASWSEIGRLLPGACGIALIGFTDNVLTGRAVASRRGYRIDANQELLALGAINLASGLSQGFPISSSASRTAVPASLGSRTQLVSVIGSAFVITALVVFRDALAHIPRAALAAVIVTAAISIIDVRGLVQLWHLQKTDLVLALVTAGGVTVVGVLPGVAIAVAVSLAIAIGRVARPHDAVLGDAPGLDGWVDLDDNPAARTDDGLLVFRFDAPLFFLNVERYVERVQQALSDNPGEEDWLVLDFEGIGAIDTSAVQGLSELVEQLQASRPIVIAIARANHEVSDMLRRAGLAEPQRPVRHYATINAAVKAFRTRRRPPG